jgi:hypothetical protein
MSIDLRNDISSFPSDTLTLLCMKWTHRMNDSRESRYGVTGYLSNKLLNLLPISDTGINSGMFCIKS